MELAGMAPKQGHPPAEESGSEDVHNHFANYSEQRVSDAMQVDLEATKGVATKVFHTIWGTLCSLPWLPIVFALALVLGFALCLIFLAVAVCIVEEGSKNSRQHQHRQQHEAVGGKKGALGPVTTESNGPAVEPEDTQSESGADCDDPPDAGLVSSPYCSKPEEGPRMHSLILQLLRLFRICVPSMISQQGAFLCGALLLALFDGILECLVPSIIVRPLWTMVKENDVEQFQAFAVFMMVYNTWIAIVKSSGNYCAMRAMIACRCALVNHLHSLYMSHEGRLYYTLGNLDCRVDTPDGRITNDADLLMQFLFEFIFGGIMKPESGMCSQIFFVGGTLGVAYFEAEAGAPGWGLPSIGVALGVVLASLLPTLFAANFLTKAQAKLQSSEAGFRAAHAKCRLFAESICFYSGESTEAEHLEVRISEVCAAFKLFAFYKLGVDLIQLSVYFGIAPISCILAAFIVRKGEWTEDSETTFYVLNLTFIRIIRCCMEVSRNIVDLAKAQAMLQRIMHLIEVMDELYAFERHSEEPLAKADGALIDEEERFACMTYYKVNELYSSEVVPVRTSPGILFDHVDVYTPDGHRLLLEDVCLKLDPGESCLIMGPSGIGKSSILRVLGHLWPLFHTPGGSGRQASFSRPGHLNVFFLAQRPYLFEGTLREQVAYPIWNDSLLSELSDKVLARLFREANLDDVWEASKFELDTPGICWEDVLSLGEQQRLQFCRLFWHAEWHRNHADNSNGFFAVLDESSASMDTSSEMLVYQACCDRKFGFLSVAHRPTVIQFHSRVLHFQFDNQNQLRYRVRDASKMAMECAHQIRNDTLNNAELRSRNPRRSLSISGSNNRKLRPPRRSNSSPMTVEALDDLDDVALTVRSISLPNAMTFAASSLSPTVRRTSLVPSLRQLIEEQPESMADSVRPHTFTTDEDEERTSLLSEDGEGRVSMAEAEKSDGDVLVVSPYASTPELGTRLGMAGNLWRFVLLCHQRGGSLAALVLLNLLAAVMLSAWAVVFMNLKSIVQRGKTTDFQALGHNTGIRVSYEDMLPLILAWGPLLGAVKTAANYLTVLIMIDWRRQLLRRLQAMYLGKGFRLYYILSNLDMRVDAADQRITNDVDLMMQFLFEFFSGGVMKPDSGVLFKCSVFLVSCCVIWLDVERTSPGQGGFAPALASALFIVSFVLTERLGRRCGRAQTELQKSEGAFRAAHVRCRTYAEGISFYGGEATEKASLDSHFKPVMYNFIVFARLKFPMEVLQLFLFQSQYSIAMLLGGVVAFKEEDDRAQRTKLFDLTNTAMVSCLQALNKITCQVMDFAKACALSSRVSKLYEVMQAFLLHASTCHSSDTDHEISLVDPLLHAERIGCCCPNQVLQLNSGSLVPVEVSPGVVFRHIDVYTPDGHRLLLRNVSLRLDPGERCLIMGPSGIGKSSLLRVLGQLWPLFRSPGEAGQRAKFSRPGPRNVFFLAQRPYLFEGTLRQQVAYPNWDKRMIDELSNEHMARLFREASLEDVWHAHKHELDVTGISWADVLSLGEQQRLQFVRLFWHHDWVKRYGEQSQGFFAVLDESSASMDTTSETRVYNACCQRKIGLLSVAHRPTVIQFHSKVLHFEFDERHELQHRVRDAKEMAREAAALLTKHLRGGGGLTQSPLHSKSPVSPEWKVTRPEFFIGNVALTVNSAASNDRGLLA